MVVTARIRRMGENNIFTGVCPFIGGYPGPRCFPRSFRGGGVPQSQVLSQVSWSQVLSRGGTPVLAGGYPSTGIPWPGQDGVHPPIWSGWGTPWPGQDGTAPPSQVRIGDPPPLPGLGYPVQDRTAERELTTRRAVFSCG